MDFTWKLFAETTCFSLVCTASDVKVTWRDKAFSDLEINMESKLLVMLHFNHPENIESYGKEYVDVKKFYFFRIGRDQKMFSTERRGSVCKEPYAWVQRELH